MTESNELRAIVDELIEILHVQVEDLERLIAHVENQTTRAPYASQLPVVRSKLSELHRRVGQLAEVS